MLIPLLRLHRHPSARSTSSTVITITITIIDITNSIIYRSQTIVNYRSLTDMLSERKLILAINAGSSSVKLSLYSSAPPPPDSGEVPAPKLLLESSISNLTSPPAVFKYTHAADSSSPSPSNISSEELPDVKSQEDAFKHFLECLSSDSELKQVSSGEDIAFACHRIVHGGDYEEPVLLGEESLDYLEELTDLAPL